LCSIVTQRRGRGGGGRGSFTKIEGVCHAFKFWNLRVFSPKRSTAVAFVVPFRVFSQKNMAEDNSLFYNWNFIGAKKKFKPLPQNRILEQFLVFFFFKNFQNPLPPEIVNAMATKCIFLSSSTLT